MVTLIGGLAGAFAWALPLVLAKIAADSLDLLPYFECLGAGLVLGVAASRVLVVLARKRFPGFTSHRAVTWGLAIIIFAPTWTVGAGLGANRWLDRSPAVEYETRILRWELPIKSRARCRVTSWRGGTSEIVTDALIAAAEPTSPPNPIPDATAVGVVPYPRACIPGNRLVVASHPGALGWEWIERVRVP